MQSNRGDIFGNKLRFVSNSIFGLVTLTVLCQYHPSPFSTRQSISLVMKKDFIRV